MSSSAATTATVGTSLRPAGSAPTPPPLALRPRLPILPALPPSAGHARYGRFLPPSPERPKLHPTPATPYRRRPGAGCHPRRRRGPVGPPPPATAAPGGPPPLPPVAQEPRRGALGPPPGPRLAPAPPAQLLQHRSARDRDSFPAPNG